LPIDINTETIINTNSFVKGSLIFGRGRFSNGVLIEPASYEYAQQIGLEEFRNSIWFVGCVYFVLSTNFPA